jgi:hypothetical protein
MRIPTPHPATVQPTRQEALLIQAVARQQLTLMAEPTEIPTPAAMVVPAPVAQAPVVLAKVDPAAQAEAAMLVRPETAPEPTGPVDPVRKPRLVMAAAAMVHPVMPETVPVPMARAEAQASAVRALSVRQLPVAVAMVHPAMPETAPEPMVLAEAQASVAQVLSVRPQLVAAAQVPRAMLATVRRPTVTAVAKAQVAMVQRELVASQPEQAPQERSVRLETAVLAMPVMVRLVRPGMVPKAPVVPAEPGLLPPTR